MIASIKNEFHIQLKNFLQISLMVFIPFIIGIAIPLIAVYIFKQTHSFIPVELGTSFALLFGLLSWLFTSGTQTAVGINLAVGMGVTRKHFIVSHYIVSISYGLLLLVPIFVLNQLEIFILNAVSGNHIPSFDLPEYFIELVLTVVAGAIICNFFGALVLRFGTKVLWILWSIWMFCTIFLPRVNLHGNDENPTLLGNVLLWIIGLFSGFSVVAWSIFSSILILICLVGAVILLMKQQVVD